MAVRAGRLGGRALAASGRSRKRPRCWSRPAARRASSAVVLSRRGGRAPPASPSPTAAAAERRGDGQAAAPPPAPPRSPAPRPPEPRRSGSGARPQGVEPSFAARRPAAASRSRASRRRTAHRRRARPPPAERRRGRRRRAAPSRPAAGRRGGPGGDRGRPPVRRRLRPLRDRRSDAEVRKAVPRDRDAPTLAQALLRAAAAPSRPTSRSRRPRSSTSSPAPPRRAYPLSVSLLRVGVTSELRLELEQRRRRTDGSSATCAADGRTACRSAERHRGSALAAQAAPAAAPLAAEPRRRPPRRPRGAAHGPRADRAERSTPAPEHGEPGAPTPAPPAAPQPADPGVRAAALGARERRSAPRSSAEADSRKRRRAGADQLPLRPRRPPSAIPSLPASSCATTGVPPVLIPIYQRAADAYGLGPQGPAILAGINADRDRLRHQPQRLLGRRDRLDAVHARNLGELRGRRQRRRGRGPLQPRRRDLRRRQLPAAPPACRRTPTARSSPTTTPTGTSPTCSPTPAATPASRRHDGGASTLDPAAPGPQLHARPRTGTRQIPEEYLNAFEAAAGRYELGRRGVWALAAIARLESNFGRGMSKEQLQSVRAARPRPDRVAAPTRSTATRTAASATPASTTRRRPWRG